MLRTGFGGAVHAAVAPLSTRIIDEAAYEGVDVRKMVGIMCLTLRFWLLIIRLGVFF